MKKTFNLLSVLMVAVLMALSCSPNKVDSDVKKESLLVVTESEKIGIKKIGISLYYQKDEWYVGVYDEFKKQGEERGYEIYLTDADADFQKQVEDIENLVNQGVDLVMLAPVSDDAIVSIIDDVRANDIPVLAYGTQPAGGDYFSYVGWDVFQTGYDLGKTAVEYIKSNLDGKANVVMLEVPTLENLRFRAEGFRASLDESGLDINYIATENYEGDREKAMNKMETIIQKGDQIDIVFAAQDPGAFGARAAVESAGISCKIFSCGGYGDEVYNAFADNDPYIYADIIVSPYLFVKGIYEALDSYVAGNDIETVYNISIDVCTAQNYKEVWGE